MILDYATTSDVTILPLLRVLRVLRIIKLVPKARGLQLMLTTLLWSLPALLNVATVLLLFMYIYVSQCVWASVSQYVLFAIILPRVLCHSPLF